MVTDADSVENESIRAGLPYEDGVRLIRDRRRSSLGGRGAREWDFSHRRTHSARAKGSISMHFKKLLRPDPTEQYSRVTAVPEDIPCALCDSTTLAFRKQGRKLFQIKHIISITFAIVTIFISACPSPAILVFILNLIAIVPLSITLTLATEQLSHDLGETTGALLNITIGNLAELIILTALMKDNIKVVQASLLGSILVNLLLVLGSAIIAGGILSPDQTYNNDLTQSYVGLLNLTVACLMIPTAFYGSVKSIKSADHMSLAFSRGVSVILLIIYFLYLFFQFNTHKHLFRPRAAGIQVADIPAERHAIRSSLEELFGDIESNPSADDSITGESSRQPEMREVSAAPFPDQSPEDIHPEPGVPLLNSTERHDQSDFRKAQPHRCKNKVFANRIYSLILLVTSTVLIAICAEFFASSFDVLNEKGILGESFVGLIVIPVAGNVAENVTAVMVAARDQMDLAISVALGSAIQIGLLVAPVIVLVAWGLGKPMTLHFDYFGLITLVGSGILVSFLVLKGKTNYLEGAILCASFAAISVGAFLLPIH